MTQVQAFIAQAGVFLFVIALLGMLIRGKSAQWWFFTAYLAVVSTASFLIAFWPSRFWNADFWLLQETLTNLLRFGTVLELAFRTFRWFPGALSTLRWAVLLVLTLTVGQLLTIRPASLELASLLSQQHTVVLNGSVWLFTVIAVFILWYRLPINGFHKRVLLSWVPYLLLFTVATKVLTQVGWLRDYLMYVRQIAFGLLGGYWAFLAWRRDERPGEAPRLQPAPALGRPRPA